MRRKQVDLIWLVGSIVSFLLLAISFLLMSIESGNTSDSISVITIVSGAIFWVSIILGIVTQCVLTNRRKKWYAENRVSQSEIKQRIGLISFFKSKYAAVADIITAISLIGFIIAVFVTQGTGVVCYVFLAVFVFSFSLHCILNGKNFYYVLNQERLLSSNKSK